MIIYMGVTMALLSKIDQEAAKKINGIIKQTETGVQYVIEKTEEEIKELMKINQPTNEQKI